MFASPLAQLLKADSVTHPELFRKHKQTMDQTFLMHWGSAGRAGVSSNAWLGLEGLRTWNQFQCQLSSSHELALPHGAGMSLQFASETRSFL